MLVFNKSIHIGKSTISEHSKTFIIAEAGVNHNGDMDKAKQMIDLAVQAGVDAVKFQTFRAKNLILKNVSKAPYQQKTTDSTESQYDMLKRLEMSKEQNNTLNNYCLENNITFLTTPFDEESIDSLDDLQLPAYKVASTDLTNLPFLKKISKKQKPIILSAGMSFLSEVELALKEMYEFNKDIILLQCSANYPISNNEANLNIIKTFQSCFDIIVGYSDHSVGIGATPYAVAAGAKVIEKHFTLDKSLSGPDHKASLNPDELLKLVKEIRSIEEFLGSFIKTPTFSEVGTRKSLQKCLVFSQNITKGSIITENHIVGKRTGGIGISPIYYKSVIGKTVKKDFKEDEIVEI